LPVPNPSFTVSEEAPQRKHPSPFGGGAGGGVDHARTPDTSDGYRWFLLAALAAAAGVLLKGPVALALVGCASASKPPPEPAFVVTWRPAEPDPPRVELPAPRCVAPAMRARIEECATGSTPDRMAVDAAIEESYLALTVRPGEKPNLDTGVRTHAKKEEYKEEYEEERRLLAPLALLPEQERAVALLTSWVCQHPNDLGATFRLALLRFEHRRFEEAIVYFARVGDGPPDDDLSVEAFFRWLETTNVLGAHFLVTTCFDEMSEKVPGTFKRLCNPELVERFPQRAGRCAQLGVIEYELLRMTH